LRQRERLRQAAEPAAEPAVEPAVDGDSGDEGSPPAPPKNGLGDGPDGDRLHDVSLLDAQVERGRAETLAVSNAAADTLGQLHHKPEIGHSGNREKSTAESDLRPSTLPTGFSVEEDLPVNARQNEGGVGEVRSNAVGFSIGRLDISDIPTEELETSKFARKPGQSEAEWAVKLRETFEDPRTKQAERLQIMHVLAAQWRIDPNWGRVDPETGAAILPSDAGGRAHFAKAQGVLPDAHEFAEPASKAEHAALRRRGEMSDIQRQKFFMGPDGRLYRRTAKTLDRSPAGVNTLGLHVLNLYKAFEPMTLRGDEARPTTRLPFELTVPTRRP
jgi:hypothetical protein